MKINKTHTAGFTLVEIMIVVAIIGLLAAIAIPNFARARVASQTTTCINNLRQIDGAIQEWALEQKKAGSAAVDETDIAPFMRNIPVCPAGGSTFGDSYGVTTVSELPICTRLSATHVLP